MTLNVAGADSFLRFCHQEVLWVDAPSRAYPLHSMLLTLLKFYSLKIMSFFDQKFFDPVSSRSKWEQFALLKKKKLKMIIWGSEGFRPPWRSPRFHISFPEERRSRFISHLSLRVLCCIMNSILITKDDYFQFWTLVPRLSYAFWKVMRRGLIVAPLSEWTPFLEESASDSLLLSMGAMYSRLSSRLSRRYQEGSGLVARRMEFSPVKREVTGFFHHPD